MFLFIPYFYTFLSKTIWRSFKVILANTSSDFVKIFLFPYFFLFFFNFGCFFPTNSRYLIIIREMCFCLLSQHLLRNSSHLKKVIQLNSRITAKNRFWHKIAFYKTDVLFLKEIAFEYYSYNEDKFQAWVLFVFF